MARGLGELLRSADDPADDAVGRARATTAVKAFFRAIAARDMTALGQALTDDAIYEMPFSESGSTAPGFFRRFEGREAVVGFWEMTSGGGIISLPPQDVELSITADGGRLFIEQRGDMTMPDGKPYRNRYVFRFDIRDGRVSHIREYINPIISAYAFDRPVASGVMVSEVPLSNG